MNNEDARMTRRSIELTKTLISMRSVSGSSEQDSTFLTIVNQVSKIPGARVSVSDNGMSAVFTTGLDDRESPDRPKKSVVFVGHIDTVPPMDRDSWQSSPFEADERDGRLYGRGSSDMKSGLAAALAVFERACREGLPCVVAMTKDEEIGCLGAPSAVEILDRIPMSGMVIMESTNNIIRFGHRGALWLRLISRGKAAHGSNPSLGVNAIVRMMGASAGIQRIPLESDDCLGNETCNLGTMHGGAVPNIVPDYCAGELDIRTVRDHADSLVEYLQSIDGIDEVETEFSLSPVWTDPDDPWVASLPGERDVEPVTYFTEASIFAAQLSQKIPIIVCGPGDPTCVHSVNESVPLQAIAQATEHFWNYIQ
ncbi:M20 family metallopeptidase [Bifidobacterium aquikefiricola]|uniref:M20/M25/M40 family metallo-hydrolase n=1 Tax=Bifidobacterium aquikefiricola TaxID=3059038 RepID=A0AB39U5N0_9BIFI